MQGRLTPAPSGVDESLDPLSEGVQTGVALSPDWSEDEAPSCCQQSLIAMFFSAALDPPWPCP